MIGLSFAVGVLAICWLACVDRDIPGSGELGRDARPTPGANRILPRCQVCGDYGEIVDDLARFVEFCDCPNGQAALAAEVARW